MKRIALAVTAALTLAAPAAYAQYDRPYREAPDYSRYDNRDTARDWRIDEGHDYRNEPYSARDYRNRDRESARVLEARPLYAAGSAREECWNNRSNRYEELRASRESHIGAGTAIGAVAGGVVGHQVGSGNGNTVATAAGALLGGLLGHNIENRGTDDEPDFDRSRCRVLAQRGAAPVAYDVRYEYNGQEYVARMDHDPGRRVRIGQDVGTDGTPFDSAETVARPSWYSGG